MANRVHINDGPWQPLYSPQVEKVDLFCHWCGGRCEARLKHLVLCNKKWCKKHIRPLLKELMKKSKSA